MPLAGRKQGRARLSSNIHQKKGMLSLREMMGEDSKCCRMWRWLRAAERMQLRYLLVSLLPSQHLWDPGHIVVFF